MTKQQTPDREKKIAEIREVLEKATPWPWKIADTTDGYVLLDADDRELAFFDSIGRADVARFIANAPEWLRFLTQAVEMYRELMHELDKENDHLHEKINELEKLKQERDKLIEVLRWYADKTNYVQEVHHLRHGTLIGPAEAIYYDDGQRARNILKEIGVTVE